MHQTDSGVYERHQLVPYQFANRFRLNGIAMTTISIEGVASIIRVFRTLQIRCGRGKEQDVAVKQRHSVRIVEERYEIEHFRREQVGIAEFQAARKSAQNPRELRISLPRRMIRAAGKCRRNNSRPNCLSDPSS